jgi:formyltetrahydrofolate deformylase
MVRPAQTAVRLGSITKVFTGILLADAIKTGKLSLDDVCRVTHRDDVADLTRKGRELERQVLTRAVRMHLERRVLVYENRTIVFG